MGIKNLAIIMLTALLANACSKGGKLTLEKDPGATPPIPTNGNSSVATSLGGSSLVIEQGKTKATGYHGWVSINAVTNRQMDGGLHTIKMDKAPLNQ